MKTQILYLLLCICYIYACGSTYPSNRSSSDVILVEIVADISPPGAEGPTDPGQRVRSKVWYKDSFAIEEIVSIKSVFESGKGIKHEYPIQHYRFTDLRKRAIYLYQTLTDTATCFRNFSFSDSVEIVGGWGFNFRRSIKVEALPAAGKDTVWDGVIYKRMYLSCNENNRKVFRVVFFRCDKKFHPFNFDSSLSEKTGCPLTLSYYTDSSFSAKPILMDKIEFLRDTLTKVENNIFDAWERYAKAHPVRGKSL
jgi:hypothetical protein